MVPSLTAFSLIRSCVSLLLLMCLPSSSFYYIVIQLVVYQPHPQPVIPKNVLERGGLSHLGYVDQQYRATGWQTIIMHCYCLGYMEPAQKLYSKRKNACRLYTLRKQVHECKKGTMDITSYFNKLSLIWQKMDLYREIIWNCPSDGIQHSHLEEVDCIYDFLAGLNSNFHVVCGCILGQRPINSLIEVCSEVRLEDHMSDDISTTLAIDFAVFSARSSTHDSEKHNGKVVPVCKHCKKQWHTKEPCWKLHDRPLGGQKRPPNDKQNPGRAYVSESTGNSQPFSSTGNHNEPSSSTLGVIAQSSTTQFLSLIIIDGKRIHGF